MVEIMFDGTLMAEFPTMQEALEWIDPFQTEPDMCFEVVGIIVSQL